MRHLLIILVFSLIGTTRANSAPLEDQLVLLTKHGPHGISDWVEFEIKEGTPAYLIELVGRGSTLYQVIDLVDPAGLAYVKSNAGDTYNGYVLPMLQAELSLNRSVAVMNNYGSLLVPNFPSPSGEQVISAGTWRARVMSSKHTNGDAVVFRVVPSKAAAKQRKVNVRLWIDKASYWHKNPDYVDQMIDEAKHIYSSIDIELVVEAAPFSSPIASYDPPNDVSSKITETGLLRSLWRNSLSKREAEPAVDFLLLGKTVHQKESVNGISCLAGLFSPSGCYAAMFAGPFAASTVSSKQAGKILAHELGHYLGLVHTVDHNYMFVGTIFDRFDDTPEEVTGANIMDPGVHLDEPTFSNQQALVLRRHPLVLDK